MKSAGHFPSEKEANCAFVPYHSNVTNVQASRHSNPTLHAELYPGYPQCSVLQQEQMFIRPPQVSTLTTRYPLPTSSLSNSRLQVQQSGGTVFPFYPSCTQALGGYSAPKVPSQIYPIGEPVPAINLQTGQYNQPVKPIDLDSILQATSSIQPCQYENSEKIQFGNSLNPIINFAPVNQLLKSRQLNSAAAQPILHEHNFTGIFDEMHVQNKTDNDNTSQMSTGSLSFVDTTGHVDVVGDTMFLRTDNNTNHHDNLPVKTNNNETPSLSVDSHQCSKCFLSFSSISDLAIHLKAEHYGANKRNKTNQPMRFAKSFPNLFRCDICGCDFFFDSDLLDHQRTVHIPFLQERLEKSVNKSIEFVNKQTSGACVKETEQGALAMENFDKDKGNEKERVSSLNQKLNIDQTKEVSLVGISAIQSNNKNHQNSPDDEIIVADTDYENRWLCSLCTQNFMNENEFIVHMKDNHGETTEVSTKISNTDNQEHLWKCDICGGEYFFDSDLKDHQEKVHCQEDVIDDGGESMRNELIVKLTMKKGKGKTKDETQHNRGRGRVWMPSDYIYNETRSVLERNRGNQREWRQVDGTHGRKRRNQLADASNEMYIEHNVVNQQKTAHKESGRNMSTKAVKSSSSSGRGSLRCKVGRVWGKSSGKCKDIKVKSNKQKVLEPYESNESDIEIIEEPVLVIEIDDQEDSPKKADTLKNRNENPFDKDDRVISNKCIFFYCGLCAFKCQSNDILDEHMESHSLNGEICQESTCTEPNDKIAKELLCDKYLTIDVERLSLDSNLRDRKAWPKHQVVRHLGQAFYETETPDKEKDCTIDINKLLQDAGLGTSNLNSSMVSKRRLRMSEQDKILMKKHEIQEVSVVLNHPKCTNSNLIPDHTSLPTNDWLNIFNDHSDESDIDWDLPPSTFDELDDGYEADQDDNSDILVTNKIEKPGQNNVKNCSNRSPSHTNISPSKKSKVSVIEIDDAIIGKRVLRSDKISPQSNVKKFKRALRPSLSAEQMVPVNSFRTESKGLSNQLSKKYVIQETRVCYSQHAQKNDSNLMMKYGIKDSKVCLTDLGKRERKIKLERENSQMFNISETSWWDEKKVKDKIDFSKTPIVPLKRIDIDEDVIISSIVKNSKGKKATTKNKIEDTNTTTNLMRSLRSDHMKTSHEIVHFENKNRLESKTQNRSKVPFRQHIGKIASPKKRNIDWDLKTSVKKSSRLMDQASATKRKALQKALSLIKNKDTQKKKVIKKPTKIFQSTKTIENRSSGLHTSKILHNQRKRIFEENNKEPTTATANKDCVVKLARLNMGEIKNWKKKENDTENKIKEQMLKILTPEKIKARVIVDKLPSETLSSTEKCTNTLIDSARGMGKKNLTHEFSLDVENTCSKTENYAVDISTNQHLDFAESETEKSDVKRQSEDHDVEMSRNGNAQVIGFVKDILDLILERVVNNDNVD